MRLMLMVLLVAAACGRSGEGWVCKVDADCNKGLMCGLLQSPDGAKRTMCVNPDGTWDMSAKPKSYRTYALPVGVVGGAVLVMLLMLRASVIAREKRKRAKAPPA